MRFLFVPLVALTLLTCKDAAPPEAAPVVRPVNVQQVFAQGGKRLRTFSGSARAGLASKLSFRVAGTIQELPVKLGDRVKKGALIARLDDRDYRLQLDDASASLRQAEAQSRNASANYERIRGLYENNSVSINDLDAARAGTESAAAQVQSITKKLELAKSQLSYTELRAPLSGSIADLKAEVNENVGAGQAIAVLNAGSRAETTFAVPEQLITEIREGDPVKVRFDAISEREFDATVTEVGVAAGGLGTTYPVVARLTTAVEEVREGMAAEISVIFGKDDDRARIYVKPKAIVEDQAGQTFVYIAEPTSDGQATVKRLDVATGELTRDGMEVREGLADGQFVITAGLRFLQEGMTVKLPVQGGE